MENQYLVSVSTYFETECLHIEELWDFGDEISHQSYEYFYNCKNRIGFGDRPYSLDFVRKWWRDYDPSTVIMEQRVSVLGHCKECAIEQVEKWFREHEKPMGKLCGPSYARVIREVA